MTESTQKPVAIVGMACLLPKAPNLAAYWRNIVDARDCLTDIPEGHSWSPKDYYDADPSTPDKTWATRGGFIDPQPFDPMEHGVIPVALEAIDSDQLLALLVARECLKDAGINVDSDGWDREKVACILGHTSTSELVVDLSARLHGPVWHKAMERCGIDSETANEVVKDINRHFPTWQEQSFPGMLANVVSGRIANRLDLGGTNATVDAACASSLAALQYAVSEVQNGNADIAISGGSDTLNDIFMYMCFSKTPALSQTGDARPFDKDADGIVISEGIAMVALKRLEDAERDGDRIYAVIRGIGTSSDGRNKSIYAPNHVGQTKAIRRAYENAGFPLETVELIEAHGTGTRAGDLAEYNGLRDAFADSTRPGSHVAVGSVKSQIGHTKATAGTAGLLKAVLALHQKVLPPTAKVKTPNPHMNFEETVLYVNGAAKPWIRQGDTPRRAGVSAFGFGGTNYHIALEEYDDESIVDLPASHQLFLVSADSADALGRKIEQLRNQTWATVETASRALLADWSPQSHVVAFTADTMDALETSLATATQHITAGASTQADGVHYGCELQTPKLGVVFPGQGSQYVNMGRTVALRHPQVRRVLDRASRTLNAQGRPGLADVIYPPTAFSKEAEQAQAQTLTATQWAQPAIGALSKGLFDLLTDYGVQADALAGHSYGELVALCAAGVMDEDALWTASRVRGEAMAVNGVDRGTMAAVSAPLDDITAVLEGLSDGVVLANRNHPKQGVISGSREGIAKAIEAMNEAGFSAREIPVSAAFHSTLVADAQTPFTKAIEELTFSAPHTPVYSNVTAKPYPANGQRDLLSQQITSTVDFVGVVEAMVEQGIRTFVECGPKGVMTGLLRRCLKGVEGVQILNIDGKAAKVDGDLQFKTLLAQLAATGVAINVAPLLNEAEPTLPRQKGSKATIELAGANYKRPDTLAPEAPEIKHTPAPTPRTSTPETVHQAVQAQPTPVVAKGPSKMNDDTLNSLLEATRQSLVAFQKTQEQTAEVHAQFLQAHAKANENFASLFQAHSALLHTALGQGVPQTARPAATPSSLPTAPIVAPNASRQAMTEALLQPTQSVHSALNLPNNERVKAAPSAELPPVMRASTLSELIKTGTALPSTPTPTVQPQANSVDVGETLLGIVADKTGYPRDLVQFSMDLESDLGIDSIKRVEILSAVQEALPQLPELDAETAGGLRTLADIRDQLTELLPSTSSPTETPAPNTPDVATLLIGTIAEKTGYPVDLIEIGMDLESDLGIDSIKRVEILSAIQDGLPQVGELDADVFGGLRTVGALIEQLNEMLPSASASPATSSPSVDYSALLIDIVATRTGYPAELVEPGMDLESDLGIDSIKRVEILSAVQEALPNLPDLDEEAYSAARTITDIVELLRSADGGTTQPLVSADTSSAQASVKPNTESTRREVLVRPAPEGETVVLPTHLVLIADDAEQVKDLTQALRELTTVTCVTLQWGQPVLEQLPADVDGILFMGTIGAESDTLHHRMRVAFELAKGFPSLQLFATVTGLGGTFGHERFKGAALEGALPGLVKTLAQERPNTRCLALDIDPESWEAATIINELQLNRGVLEVGLTDEPITLQASPIAINPETVPQGPLSEGDLIVVSGGARGVTAAVVKEMANRWKPSFLLLGRSEWPDADPTWAEGHPKEALNGLCISHLKSTGEAFKPTDMQRMVDRVLRGREMRETLSTLHNLGLNAMYRSVDVRDGASVRTAMDEAVDQWGPVRGIVHGAGVIADKRIDEKTLEQFDFVFGTKVEGLEHLLLAADSEQLKLLAVFSSVAGRYGNLGQVDYAMANEAITHIAHQYASTVQTKAFHWGPWAGGMVTPALKAALEARGMQVIPIQQGAKQFCDEFERGGPSVEVVIGGPDQAAGLLAGNDDTPQFPSLTNGSKTHTIDGSLGFLDDHRIGGKPVLPFVMVLEWMAEAAQETYPDYYIAGVRDLAVLKGVVLDDQNKTLTLEWTPTASSNGSNGALEFRLLGDIGPMNLPTVHYKGTVELSKTPSTTNRFPGSNGLGKGSYPYTVKEAYERFLFHGPGLQGINNIVGMSDHGIVATLDTSRPKQLGVNKTLWETDPVALDSALQLVGLWVREKRGASALPCYVEEYQQFAPFRSEVTCHIEMEPTKTARGRFQATFVDPQGRVVASVNGGQYASRKGLNDNFKNTSERPN